MQSLYDIININNQNTLIVDTKLIKRMNEIHSLEVLRSIFADCVGDQISAQVQTTFPGPHEKVCFWGVKMNIEVAHSAA